MKHLLPLLLLATSALLAEPVTVREAVILKAARAVISVKAGTVVELVARDGDTATITYRNVTGKIPASKLADAGAPADAPKAEEKKALPADTKLSAGQTPGAQLRPATAGTNPGPVATGNGAPATVNRPPQTTYGKAVQKAKDNAAAHDKHQVKPTDEILKEKE